MKKQYVIPAILMSVTLVACGNKSKLLVANEIESETTDNQLENVNNQLQYSESVQNQDQNQNNSVDRTDISQ